MKLKLLLILSLLGSASFTPTAASAREVGASDPYNWCVKLVNWKLVWTPCTAVSAKA